MIIIIWHIIGPYVHTNRGMMQLDSLICCTQQKMNAISSQSLIVCFLEQS